jgi:hypothetical protein
MRRPAHALYSSAGDAAGDALAMRSGAVGRSRRSGPERGVCGSSSSDVAGLLGDRRAGEAEDDAGESARRTGDGEVWRGGRGNANEPAPKVRCSGDGEGVVWMIDGALIIADAGVIGNADGVVRVGGSGARRGEGVQARKSTSSSGSESSPVSGIGRARRRPPNERARALSSDSSSSSDTSGSTCTVGRAGRGVVGAGAGLALGAGTARPRETGAGAYAEEEYL